MFPQRRVNALTPIFASLDREKEQLRLPPKIPLRYVKNSQQQLQTFGLNERVSHEALAKQFSIALAHYQAKDNEHRLSRTAEFATDTPQQAIFAPLITPFEPQKQPQQPNYAKFANEFSAEDLCYGDIIQYIANKYQVLIAMDQPNKAAQIYVQNGYPCLDTPLPLPTSERGIAAGLLPLSQDYFDNRQQHHAACLAQLTQAQKWFSPLRLNAAQRQNVLDFAKVTQLYAYRYAASYAGGVQYFNIDPNSQIVTNDAHQNVLVLADHSSGLPVIAPYQLRVIAGKKDTANQILHEKNQLIPAVLKALNQEVMALHAQQQHLFFYRSNLPSTTRTLWFFPRQPALLVIGEANQAKLLEQSKQAGYLI